MTQPATPYADLSPQIRFTTWFRSALSIAALLTSILPVPVLLLRLMPAYAVQTEFLVFYAPLVCLLALSYLLYVRDILARAMFADVLNPPAESDAYFGEPQGAGIRRAIRRIRSAVLALLPIALLLISSYCAVQYLSLINHSVGQAAAEQKERAPAAETSRVESGKSRAGGVTSRPRVLPRSRANSAPDTAREQESSDSLRRVVLRTARIEDIPLFTRLNILFLGIFLAAEIAFILMALKEYAREALGLTERDLMLRGSPTAAA